MPRTGIFVSYSKNDIVWKDRLLAHLNPLLRMDEFDYFDDQMIKIGEDWEDKIERALSQAKIIVVIVSQHFFGSDYIFTKELPTAVEKAKSDGALLIQIAVRECYIPEDYGLNLFQAAHDITKPLNAFDEGYHDQVFTKVASQISLYARDDLNVIPAEDIANLVVDQNTKPSVSDQIVGSSGLSKEQVALACSEKGSQIRALQSWVENTLSEWKMMDDKINSYEVRIKTVDTLYEKVLKIQAKEPSRIKSVDDVFDAIDDLVGARVLVYSPSHIMSMHLEVLAHPRFTVDEITIHRNDEFSTDVIQNIVKLSKNSPEIKLNIKDTVSGYTAVHYLISPDPVDLIYKAGIANIFPKFELQVRTVVQHAWSETEHRAIYKSTSYQEKATIKAKFELLAEFINNADKVLDRLSRSSTLTASRTSNIPSSDREIVIKSIDFVKSIESGELVDVYAEATKFTADNKDDIYDLLDVGSYSEKLSVAEVYLKGSLYKRAGKIYRTLLEKVYEEEGLYDWAILRFVEASDMSSEIDDSRHWIDVLGKRLLASGALDGESKKLFLGASFYAWKNKMLDLAINIGDLLTENVGCEDSPIALKAWCNQLYFLLEKTIDETYDDSQMLEKLEGLGHIEKKVLEISGNGSMLMKNHLDTLGWYYLNLGKSYISVDATKALALTQKALEYFKDILENWNGEEQPGVAALWLYHQSIADSQLRRLR